MKNLYTLIIGLLFTISAYSQCAYNNSYWETKPVPTIVGDSIVTYLYGGEYSTITELQAGNVYQISTCGDGAFDSQITIYEVGGTFLEAFNDDYSICTPQSRMYFSPFTSGNYDILVDEYNCASNTIPIAVTIKLFDTPDPIITIPTVVHVVYNNSTENISDAQIQSQLDVLNDDYRRLNSDIFSAPSRFRGFSKDIRVEFCLATRDPNGNPTTGITRTSTSYGSFFTDDDVKYNSTGGKNAWSTANYLNIWVCDLDGSILGYAQFPGGSTATDGVVIDYEAFDGNITAASGRTAAHEVGHWLDLYHIWGDDQTDCTGSDNVNDTPNQAGSTSGCPSNNPTSCSNGGFGGDMWPNFMDYTSHDCRLMFTYWQYRRMVATLYGSRNSLQTSLGCTSGSAPTANFTVSQNSGNAPLTVNFTDISTNSPSSWNWSFPGAAPSSSTSQNPVNITYNSAGTYTVTLTATNDWGNDAETKANYITVNSTIGIPENMHIANFLVFPNPNSGQFKMEFTTLKSLDIEINVMNILGQVIFSNKIENANGEIHKLLDLRQYSKGSYTLQMLTSEGQIIQKIIIE